MSTLPAGSNSPAEAGQNVAIKVKTLEPATYELHVNRQITVAELKSKLERLVQNAPASRQRVIYRGRALRDERTLQDLGVEAGDTLHMVVRPADAPENAPSGSEQGTAQPQSGQDRLAADTRTILEQIQQTLHFNLDMGFNQGPPADGDDAGPGGRRRQQQQQQQQPHQEHARAPEVPHLFASLHRYLERMGTADFTQPVSNLIPSASTSSAMEPEFEALSQALIEVLANTELSESLAALREEARRDPAGRGEQPGQIDQRQAAASGRENSAGEPARTRSPTESPARAAGESQGGSAAGAPVGASRRSGQRRGPQAPDLFGASYGYRYLPLAAAGLAALLDSAEVYARDRLAQQLHEGAAAARELALNRDMNQEPLRRHLRMLGGNLHAAAAVMMDMSRAVLATAIGLDDNPRALAAATTATLRLDGTDVDLQPVRPRSVTRGTRTSIRFTRPMNGLMEAMSTQFTMRMHPEGLESTAGGSAPMGAGVTSGSGATGATRFQPPGGMTMGAVHIDLGELPNMPGGIGGLLGNIMSAVAGGAMMPPSTGGGAGGAGATPRVTPAATSGDEGGGGGGQRQRRETPLSLLMPALTAIAGSIAAAVMQELSEGGVQPPRLLDALSRALSEHLNHVMDVLMARWEGLQGEATRQRRAARAQQQQQATPTPGEQVPPAAAAHAPAAAPTGAGGSAPGAAAAAAAAPAADVDPLEDFRFVARLINQLFPSWETVMQVPAEAPASQEEGGVEPENEGGETRAESQEQPGEGAAASRRQQQQQPAQRPIGSGGEGQGRNLLDDDVSAIARVLMPHLVGSTGRSVAQSVVAAFASDASRSGVIDGQQLALTVLQTLASRLDGLANMLLGNWARISSGLEEIETASGGASAVEVMSQMVNLAASIMSGGPPAPPAPSSAQQNAPAPQPATSQPLAQPAPSEPHTASPTPAPASAPPPMALDLAPEALTPCADSAPLPLEPPAPTASALPASDAASAAHDGTPRLEAPSEQPPSCSAPSTTSQRELSVASASQTAPSTSSDADTAPSVASSSGPKGLGLGLRPPAFKKKPAAAAAAATAVPVATPSSSTTFAAPAAAAAAPVVPATEPAGAEPEGRAAAAVAALMGRPGAGGRVGSGRGPNPAALDDPLDGLLDMMGQVLGTLDPRDPGGAMSAPGSGGVAGGGGLGGLMQMAHSLVSDPAMQPMIGNVMNMVLGGGGGAGGGREAGGGAGGLGGLLGSLLGGLPPPSGRSAAAAATAAVPISYDVLTEVLGSDDGNRCREIIERDVETMQQHVQAAPEELSTNYRRGVPSRRAGLLAALSGGSKEGQEAYEEGEDDSDDFEEGELERDAVAG